MTSWHPAMEVRTVAIKTLNTLSERATPEALDVLAFIESGMSMSGEARAERWPEWQGRVVAARSRFDRECRAHQNKWQTTRKGCSDPMVDSHQDAVFYWVYLPLIRDALRGAGRLAEPAQLAEAR
jgi:hypothetical protein